MAVKKIAPAILGLVPVVVYGITDATTGSRAFSYDTFIDFALDAKMKVSDFPVENGAFASYNKVTHPITVRCGIAITDDPNRRHKLLADIEKARVGIQRFNITTQDGVYLNLTLDSYAYRRTKELGWGQVVITLNFLQVREVNAQYTNVKVPGGNAPRNGGTVTPVQNPFLDNTLDTKTSEDFATAVAGAGAKTPSAASSLRAHSSAKTTSVTPPSSAPPVSQQLQPTFR